MSRRILSWITMLALLGQALGLTLPWGQVHAAEEVVHRFIHAQARLHQHDLDPSFFLDAADESAFHVHAQDAGQPVALLAKPEMAPLGRARADVSPPGAGHVPTVYLEGPLRPPRRLI